jgi:hypothetical protein
MKQSVTRAKVSVKRATQFAIEKRQIKTKSKLNKKAKKHNRI